MNNIYTNVFGGSPIQPADRSHRAFTITANTELSWPLGNDDTADVVADIMDVTPVGNGLSLAMPPANQVSPGESSLIINRGSSTFTVTDNSGNTIVAIVAGAAYFVYVSTNSTVDGTWGSFQFGTGTSSADAGALAGYGLTASGITLNTIIPAIPLNASTSITQSHRSSAIRWTGGNGTLAYDSGYFGPNGVYTYFVNEGAGQVSLTATSINGGTSYTLDPTESVLMVADTSGSLFPVARYEVFSLISAASFVTATSSSLSLTSNTPGAAAYEITNAAFSDVIAELPPQGGLYLARYVPVSSGTPNFSITFTSSEGFPVPMYPGVAKAMGGGGTQPRDIADDSQKAPNKNYAYFCDFSANPWGYGSNVSTSAGSSALSFAPRMYANVAASINPTTNTGVVWSRQLSTDTGFTYDMRIARVAGGTSITTIRTFGVLTATETVELRGKTPTVVVRMRMGSSNFSTVACHYYYRTSTSLGESNPITTSSQWTADTLGGPYLNTSFPTTGYSTYATKGSAAIPANAYQVAVAIIATCSGTATASDYIDVDYIGLHDGDYFAEYDRVNRNVATGELSPFYIAQGIYTSSVGGTADALTATAQLPLISIIDGMPFTVKLPNALGANTSAPTITINGEGPSDLLKINSLLPERGLRALGANDLGEEQVLYLIRDYQGSGYQVLNPVDVSHNGQCHLTVSGTSLVLLPCNGNRLLVGGVDEWASAIVPDEGISLDNSATVSGTTYYIYAHMDNGTLELEPSTSIYAPAPLLGYLTQSGDDSRSLVGMARTTTSNAWQKTATSCLVVSYFNQMPIALRNNYTANRTVTSATYAEINSEIRLEFLTFSNRAVHLMACGDVRMNSSGQGYACALGINSSTSASDGYTQGSAAANGQALPMAIHTATTFSEGYNFVTLLGLGGSGGAIWSGSSTTGARTTLSLEILG